MELGYLIKGGHYVVVDSLGERTLQKGYRVDEAGSSSEFLGLVRKMEDLGEAKVTVRLHREGWGRPSEVILRTSKGRVYRTRTGHIVIGKGWRRIKGLTVNAYFWRPRPYYHLPFLWRGKFPDKKLKVFPPPRGSKFVLRLHDQTILGCRRTGRVVEAFGVEPKESSEFIIGKLSAIVEFGSDSHAENFAGLFPAITDPGAIDKTVSVDIDRTKRLAATSRQQLGLAALASGIVLVPGLLIALAVIFRPPVELVTIPATIFDIISVLFLLNYRRSLKQEQKDIAKKWPRLYFERWASHFRERGGAMARLLQDYDVKLDPSMIDLRPIQKFLNGLPSDSFFGVIALDLAGLLSLAFLACVGRNVRYAWRPGQRFGDPIFVLDDAFCQFDFLTLVRNMWIDKRTFELDKWIWEAARTTQFRLSLQPVDTLVALGFLKDTNEIPRFQDEMQKAIPLSITKSQRMGTNLYTSTWVRKPPFEMLFVRVEKPPPGWTSAPLVSTPFSTLAQDLKARLEASTPRSPVSEDTAIVRFVNNELVPLGLLLHNYLEIGPEYVKRSDLMSVKVVAAVVEAQVLNPRIRQLGSEIKEQIMPRQIGQGGAPMDSSANFVGVIRSVKEATNPFTGLGLWHVTLGLSSFLLQVIVRKDKCNGVPQEGFFLSGSLWLIGDIAPGDAPASEYIG